MLYAMPVRLLTQSVLRWPEPDQVLQQVQAWATEQRGRCPSLQAVGLFGSYGRGTAGVGSDLDLLLVASGSRMAQELQRDLRWLGSGPQSW